LFTNAEGELNDVGASNKAAAGSTAGAERCRWPPAPCDKPPGSYKVTTYCVMWPFH
jgi:hypothetical protein